MHLRKATPLRNGMSYCLCFYLKPGYLVERAKRQKKKIGTTCRLISWAELSILDKQVLLRSHRLRHPPSPGGHVR